MNAPTTHDPMTVTTTDGVCWVRRAVTRDGHGLYAVEGFCGSCPEFLLATLPELAEHGIVGQAHALPMPVGQAPAEPGDETGRLRTALQDTLAALLARQTERDALQRENAQLRRAAGLQYERRISAARAARRYRNAWRSARRRAGRAGKQVAELETRIVAARAVHFPWTNSPHCQIDGERWPCPTITALGETEKADDAEFDEEASG